MARHREHPRPASWSAGCTAGTTMAATSHKRWGKARVLDVCEVAQHVRQIVLEPEQLDTPRRRAATSTSACTSTAGPTCGRTRSSAWGPTEPS